MGRVAACVLMLELMLGGVGGRAESQTPAVPETSVGSVLRNLASRAGVVFVGQVVRIEPKTGTVEITFQVQQAVLGTVSSTYTLREWSGLWTGGRQRYMLGQRAMVFLHATKGNGLSSPGLSSPVDGMEGVVPVVVQGADTGALLDVRWLATRVLRAVGAPIADADTGAITLADGISVAAGWRNTTLPEPAERPLPIGVRPVQPVPAQPVQSQPGKSMGVTGPPRPQPIVAKPLGVQQEPAAALKATAVHDMVQISAPEGPDATH